MVEDEPRIAELVAAALRKAGFVVDVQHSVGDACHALDMVPCDGMVLDLGSLAADVVGHLAPWAYRQGCEVALDVPEQPVSIRGDAEALSGALRNLVENAVHLAPSGSEVLVSVSPKGGISVVDHGAGVPPEQHAQAFERFWRAPGTRRQGAELGLSIVAAVAGAHGACVTVEDTPGGGATFVIDLSRR